MKISCVPEFPGYAEWMEYRRLGIAPRVFLNGTDVTRRAVAADDEKGTIHAFKLNLDGTVRVVKMMVEIETVKGLVRIEAPKVHDAIPTLGGRRR